MRHSSKIGPRSKEKCSSWASAGTVTAMQTVCPRSLEEIDSLEAAKSFAIQFY